MGVAQPFGKKPKIKIGIDISNILQYIFGLPSNPNSD